MDPSNHRKIELQSPADLTHLTTNLRALARQKLDLHLPPHPTSPTDPDELRAQVELLVDAFVAKVIAGMRHNISINGIDVVRRGEVVADVDAVEEEEHGPSVAEVEEFEPFDEKLRAKLAALTARRDALVGKISAHRRGTAREAARGFEERFLSEREGDGRMEEGWIGARAAEEDLPSVGLKRKREVESTWERAVEGLSRLNDGLPETRARLERCGDVVEYLEPGKRKGKA